jgi:hypothetical protein
MFERFTDRARRVVVLAQEEARLLEHNYIGTEHLLLGIVHEGEGIAARVLESLDVSLGAVRVAVEREIGRGSRPPVGHIPFTARAKKVLELSLRESLQLGHNYIGTEHILLGLVREGEGVAAEVLRSLGVGLDRVHATIVGLLAEASAAGEAPDVSGIHSLARESEPARVVTVTSVGEAPATCSFCGRDTRDVGRWVVAHGAVICAACVESASRVIASAPAEERGPLSLPPRVDGEPPDTEAVGAIVDAFQRAFGTGDDERASRPVEDVEQLLGAMEEAARRYPNVESRAVTLMRLRFASEAEADVGFSVTGFGFEGRAVKRGDRWLVSRDTFCRVLAQGGIECPPREEPDHP